MSTETKCDGCGCKIGTGQNPNYWSCTFEGDTLRKQDGTLIELTGLVSPGNRQYKIAVDAADVCIPCMSKVQEKT